MMDQTDSVIAVASAVTSTSERAECARDALRAWTGMVSTS
jgi:hypothetical protein